MQDWNNLAGEKSLASYDVTNRLVVSYVLTLPIGINHMLLSNISPALNRVIGGWTVDGIATLQSGFPLALTTASNQTDSQGGGSRPNVVPGASKSISEAAQSRLKEWFNTAAFTPPAPFTFGDENRTDDQLRDDGVANWDFTLGKNIPLRERTNFVRERTNFEFKGGVLQPFQSNPVRRSGHIAGQFHLRYRVYRACKSSSGSIQRPSLLLRRFRLFSG